jgi:hypothetical protein
MDHTFSLKIVEKDYQHKTWKEFQHPTNQPTNKLFLPEKEEWSEQLDVGLRLHRQAKRAAAAMAE